VSAAHFGPSRGEKGGVKGAWGRLGHVGEEEEGSCPRASTQREEGAWQPTEVVDAVVACVGRKQGRGARGPIREKKKGEMGRPQGIVNFLIYSKEFQKEVN
jgi:hypothetical protein